MGFRCVAVVGDGKGRVGVGCQAGREVSTAVKRALVDAKKVGVLMGDCCVAWILRNVDCAEPCQCQAELAALSNPVASLP